MDPSFLKNAGSALKQIGQRRPAAVSISAALAIVGLILLSLSLGLLPRDLNIIHEGHTYSKTAIYGKSGSYSGPLERTPLNAGEIWERVRLLSCSMAAAGALCLAVAVMFFARRFSLRSMLAAAFAVALTGSIPVLALGPRPSRGQSAILTVRLKEYLDQEHIAALRGIFRPKFVELAAYGIAHLHKVPFALEPGQGISSIEISQQPGPLSLCEVTCVLRLTPTTTEAQGAQIMQVFIKDTERYVVGLALDMGQDIPKAPYRPVAVQDYMLRNAAEAADAGEAADTGE